MYMLTQFQPFLRPYWILENRTKEQKQFLFQIQKCTSLNMCIRFKFGRRSPLMVDKQFRYNMLNGLRWSFLTKQFPLLHILL